MACGLDPADDAPPDRLETLAAAFASRTSEPVLAAGLFAAAGPGPSLEQARLDAWYDVLDRTEAKAEHWRDLIASHDDAASAGDAVLGYAGALVADGDTARAMEVLLDAPESVRHRADLALLDLGDDDIVAGAALRLARNAPAMLRQHSRSLERAVLAEFELEDWLTRARAWRDAGLGSRGAAELRGRRGLGETEVARRKELARCELDAGSPTRALNALPSRGAADGEELVLRSEAYRRRGWGRSPDPSADRFFATCLEEARLAAGRSEGATRTEAFMLTLECGTESGALDHALAAWRELEVLRWIDDRRGWLGRRLGVALGRRGTDGATIVGVASALPDHARCLRYWRSTSEPDLGTLEDLAAVQIADLYGTWALRLTGGDGSTSPYAPPESIGAAEPPPSVAWLLDHAGPAEASDEWQRILARRRPTASESLAAAELARRAGRPNTAIRTLRSAFPELGSVAISGVPADVALAYLPLLWPEDLARAARENGLDPWLIAGVARQESTFVARARSPAGARGVLQLLPSTARVHARALGLGSRPNLEDPSVNIRIGARELAALIRKYGALEPALAAYNAGERRVRRWRQRWPDPRVFAESIPIPETYTYVRRVVFLADAYRQVHAETWEETP